MTEPVDHIARLRRMRDNLKGAPGVELRKDRRALAWALDQLARARSAALTQTADYAAFYAEERMRLCGDAIMHDPVFSGGEITPETIRASKAIQIDGTINSAAYHAATHIADHLRKLADETAG